MPAVTELGCSFPDGVSTFEAEGSPVMVATFFLFHKLLGHTREKDTASTQLMKCSKHNELLEMAAFNASMGSPPL